jgi:hypothetical protein
MKKLTQTILPAVLMLAFIAGCEVSDPGTPLANQPPTTILSYAPLDSAVVNHYLPLSWAGNDGDGTVTGFRLFVDGNFIVQTAATDTTISFTSPTSGEPAWHTFKVQAVDNDGDLDPNPPQRGFYTTNTGPTVSFSTSGSVPNGATVSRGFRMTLAAADENRSGIEFAISIDDTVSFTEWSTDSVIIFGDPTLGMFPVGTVPVSSNALAEGAHTIYARTRDSGLALSAIVSRNVTIQLGSAPSMGAVSASYNTSAGADEFYPDGSIYKRNNAEVAVAFPASAELYFGVIHSYRYDDGAGWSAWQELPELTLSDLPTGEYAYLFQARDVTGTLSDTATFSLRIVEQTLSDSILVIDETRDGNGNIGSPTDAQVDDFYAAVLAGEKVRSVDYSAQGYVSPFDLSTVGLVVWHADDFSDQNLDNAQTILEEFMQRGGRVLISGWNVMGAFTTTATVSFGSSTFGYQYLRLFAAERDASTNVQKATGLAGVNGYPAVSIDAAKVSRQLERSHVPASGYLIRAVSVR